MMHLIRIRKLYGSMVNMDHDTFCDKVNERMAHLSTFKSRPRIETIPHRKK